MAGLNRFHVIFANTSAAGLLHQFDVGPIAAILAIQLNRFHVIFANISAISTAAGLLHQVDTSLMATILPSPNPTKFLHGKSMTMSLTYFAKFELS